MKKFLIIFGIIVLVGVVLFVAVLYVIAGAIKREAGPQMYSTVGEWTRIDEYAHAGGKTNYIVYADSQLAMLQNTVNVWQKNVGFTDVSNLEIIRSNAYATADKDIKNGQNPLGFLDTTNPPPPPFTDNLVSTNQ